MRFFEDKNYRKMAIVISIPILLIAQYYLFKFGVFKPMVKGIEIQMVKGDYIRDLDKFVIKLNETVTLSSGDYITVPSYSKKPKIWFKELDDSKILKIEGDKVIGLKEGTSSVGIMKDSRVLKKINIKVVQQKVKNLTASVSNDIDYVGDSAAIDTSLEVDYDRFKEKEKIVYESSDNSVLQVRGNTINAVGVGKASILVKSGDKKEKFNYNVRAKIAKIEIDKNIEIGVGKTKKLQPIITTSPKGLPYGNIKYELISRKLSVERAIRIDSDGTIVGIREGTEKVRISCGNKSIDINIKVVNEPIIENIIQLDLDYDIVNDKIIINLEWDYIKGILDYGLYIKNNSLQDKDFKLFKNISVKEDEIDGTKKVKATIELDLINGEIPNLSIYAVGITNTGNTKPSNIINIKPEQENGIENETVKNLEWILDELNGSVKLTWSEIDMSNVTYSVYVRDNSKGETGFVLYQNGIEGTEFSIPVDKEKLDMDIYIVANKEGKFSNPSNTLSVKK